MEVQLRQAVGISNQALLFQVLVSLSVVNISLIVLKFFHRFLLEDLMPSLLLQLFCH